MSLNRILKGSFPGLKMFLGRQKKCTSSIRMNTLFTTALHVADRNAKMDAVMFHDSKDWFSTSPQKTSH